MFFECAHSFTSGAFGIFVCFFLLNIRIICCFHFFRTITSLYFRIHQHNQRTQKTCVYVSVVHVKKGQTRIIFFCSNNERWWWRFKRQTRRINESKWKKNAHYKLMVLFFVLNSQFFGFETLFMYMFNACSLRFLW